MAHKIFRKAAGIAVAGGVVAAGLAITSMAAWSEPDSPVAVDSVPFELQHNVAGDSWVGNRADPTIAVVAIDVTGIPPGATAYGYVNVRTAPESAGGTVVMTAGEHSAGDALYETLRYGAGLVPSAADCNASGFTVADVVPFGSGLASSAAAAFPVAAAAASVQAMCIAITLPDDADSALQEQSTTLVWQFVGATG